MTNREIINKHIQQYLQRLPSPRDMPLSIVIEIQYAEGREKHRIVLPDNISTASGADATVTQTVKYFCDKCDTCDNRDTFGFQCRFPEPGACRHCICNKCPVCSDNYRADKLALVELALGRFPQPLREFISGGSDKLPDMRVVGDVAPYAKDYTVVEGASVDEETRRRVYLKMRIRYAWVARMLLSRGEEIDLCTCSEKRLRELIGPCSCEDELCSLLKAVREKLSATGLELRAIRFLERTDDR